MDNEIKSEKRKGSKSSNKIHPFIIEDIENLEKNQTNEDEKDEKRENWNGKLDFFFSALSYSVGLGAVWRFPYLCYKNGGGAFLIPYVIFMIFVGVPVMYLELSVGQFTSRGPVMSWVMVRMFKGLGISMNLINNYVNIYYIMVIAYSLYYLVLSLNSELPWAKCNDKWSSINCVDNYDSAVFKLTKCEDSLTELSCPDGKCYNLTSIHGVKATCDNVTLLESIGYHNPVYPSQDYWTKFILNKSPTIDQTGSLIWQLVISLFAAWVICFLCLFRGIKLSGKIVYFTALFPYLVLLILGIKGWTLDGADVGIGYYIKPDMSRLSDATVWKDAAVQVAFTLSLSYGGLIALASYNKYNNNILRDTVILSLANFLTCLLAGFVVFAYMGNLSVQTGLSMDKVALTGQGLVYIVYPFAVTTLGVSQLWSVMFFIMMIALGMGTMMASVEEISTSLEDYYPILKKTKKNKAITLGIICVLYFLIDLLLCSQAGNYWIELLDEYAANWSFFLVGSIECISVGWFYGVGNFKRDISTMVTSNKLLHEVMFIWWRICWTVLTPGLLIALTIFSWVDAKRMEIGDYKYPAWSEVVGNLISASSLIATFIWIIYEIVKSHKKKESLLMLLKAEDNWGPLLKENQELYLEAKKTPVEPFKEEVKRVYGEVLNKLRNLNS